MVQKVKDRYDNAMAESLLSTEGRVLAHHEACGDRAEARAAVSKWIAMYYRARAYTARWATSAPRSSRKGTAAWDDTGHRVSILDG